MSSTEVGPARTSITGGLSQLQSREMSKLDTEQARNIGKIMPNVQYDELRAQRMRRLQRLSIVEGEDHHAQFQNPLDNQNLS